LQFGNKQDIAGALATLSIMFMQVVQTLWLHCCAYCPCKSLDIHVKHASGGSLVCNAGDLSTI